MFAGNLTENTTSNSFAGHLHGRNIDIGLTLVAAERRAAKAPDYDIIARNTSGRAIRIGAAWSSESKAGHRYLSLRIDIGDGPFRVNAVQTDETRGSSYGWIWCPDGLNDGGASGWFVIAICENVVLLKKMRATN